MIILILSLISLKLCSFIVFLRNLSAHFDVIQTSSATEDDPAGWNLSRMKVFESYYQSVKDMADKLKQAKNDDFTNLTGIKVEVCLKKL